MSRKPPHTSASQPSAAVQPRSGSAEPSELLSRARFAELAGVSASLISRICKRGDLGGALEGTRINVRHPDAVAWLAERGVEPPALSTAPVESALDTTAAPPGTLLEFSQRAIREFGSVQNFEDAAKAQKLAAESRMAERKDSALAGTLIDRELVRTHVFGAIEAGNRRLLQDFPKTASIQLMGAIQAGATKEEVERLLRDLVGKQIKPVKAAVSRTLRDA